MKILIIEDEGRIARRIERMVRSILGNTMTSLEIASTLTNGIKYIKENKIDLLFLDLNLNGENGFDVMKSVLVESFHTVVISAHTDRAIEAFEYGVLDFIGKPFSEDRLTQTFSRISQKEKTKSAAKYLAISKSGKKILIKVADVILINGAGIYSEILTTDGKSYLHNKTLDALSMILPKNFVRVHRSHIANMDKAVESISEPGSKYTLILHSQLSVPIGRTKYKALKDEWF